MVGGENFREAGAKVRLISEPAKFFSEKNKKNNKNDDLWPDLLGCFGENTYLCRSKFVFRSEILLEKEQSFN